MRRPFIAPCVLLAACFAERTLAPASAVVRPTPAVPMVKVVVRAPMNQTVRVIFFPHPDERSIREYAVILDGVVFQLPADSARLTGLLREVQPDIVSLEVYTTDAPALYGTRPCIRTGPCLTIEMTTRPRSAEGAIHRR